jgi:tetratricopeptide (TPR) repeat protein
MHPAALQGHAGETIVRRLRPEMESSAYKIAAAEGMRRTPSLAAAQTVVDALLAAHRAGTLDEWLQRHRRVARWLATRALPPVLGTAGDALREPAPQAAALALLLRWAVAQLRPDRADGVEAIPREAWLDRTSWRPMLAVWCQFGFAPVPPFRDRYHGHADEAPASRLCGLWSVGTSTYYRYLDKGRRALALLLREAPWSGAQRLSLRDAVLAQLAPTLAWPDAAARRAWHARQAAARSVAQDSIGALWHLRHAGDTDRFVTVLQRHSVELANDPETDLLVEALVAEVDDPRRGIELQLARAAIARMRGRDADELAACELALRLAAGAEQPLLLGIVYGALGKFHEPRDVDRAFACYQDSADCLWRSGVGDDRSTSAPVIEAYVTTLIRLAWLHVLRNDPRSKPLLDRAAQLRERFELATPTAAMLEQTWGEYWRRAGETARAIEHKHRALLLYERIDDRQAILKTCSNLSLIYGEAKDFGQAIEYSQRVLALAGTLAVEPEIVASTRLNLGTAHFWQGDYASATSEYEQALALALRARLRQIAGRAHYNLAEVAYILFKQSRDPVDETRGDAHAAAAMDAWPQGSEPAHLEATRRLKQEILGPDEGRAFDRLLPQEWGAHHAEMAEVQRQREVLAVPVAPEAHVRAHLAIANAYLAVSVKEREAALALIARHGLGDRFTAELDDLRNTFNRELTREQQLAATWERATADLLSPQRCGAVLAQLLRTGSINKSGYGELCALSPATASKHLGQLAERGLLVQTGKGPATRYLLPG